MTECPTCGSTKVERNGSCASCNFAARKQERSKPLVIKPIKKVSEKRANQNQVYARLRLEYLEAYPACEVEDCHNKSTSIHHLRGREGEKLTDIKYFLAVCPDCHEMIHNNPQWAQENGYMILRSN